jgi:predicted translin family RNA/ssDNA-binding protein
MIDRELLAGMRERLSAYEAARRDTIKTAGDALSNAKRAIFALHRDDRATAARLLAESRQLLDKVAATAADRPGLDEEGSYRAALEEFAEASLYSQFVESGKVGAIVGPTIDEDTYIGALSDLTGEMQRRQVRLATEGKVEDVKRIKDAIEEVIAELLEMDLGGYLRNKFDQAKNNLRRAEEVLYDVTLRRG